MPYLEQERARLQAELQAADAEQSALTTKLSTQQQAVTAAQTQVSTAQTQLALKQTEVAPLQASAGVADRHVADIDRQIDAHVANEPERTIEVDGRPPRPNPAWRTWNQHMQRLSTQRTQAQTSASAAHNRLQAAQLAVSQAQAGVQAAERLVSEAKAAVAGTQTAIAGVQARQQAIQQQIAGIAKVNTEIDRDPFTRPTVEQLAAELSARVFELEDAHIQARLDQEDAEEHLRNLITRRDDLTQRTADVTVKLSDAKARLATIQQQFDIADAKLTAELEAGQ